VPIRAAMMTTNLTLGGAERWVVDLIKHSDPDRLRWTGVALSSHGGADPALAEELARYVPLYANRRARPEARRRPFHWPAVQQVAGTDFREVIRRAADGAEVIVTWGNPDLAGCFQDLTIPRVLCSHSTLRETPITPVSGVTHLAAVSEAAMGFFDGRPGAEDLPQIVLYNGADPQRCQPVKSRKAMRDSWGLSDKDIAVGYLGRQSPEKNPLAAAQAAMSLDGRGHAIYYGVGPNGRDFCTQTVLWCDRNLPGRYHMFAPVTRVGDVFQALDVLVLASQREAFSLTLIEAWLAGVPVVATPVGSIPELEARHGRLTFPVPIDPSPDDLARAVLDAIRPKLRREVVNRARRLANQEFTVQAMARRWAEYLQGVVAGT
jgi:glycosyltransferase involved in cell wall biosynthesis